MGRDHREFQSLVIIVTGRDGQRQRCVEGRPASARLLRSEIPESVYTGVDGFRQRGKERRKERKRY